MSIKFTMTLEGHKKIQRALKDPDLINGPVKDFLNSAALEVVDKAKDRSPVDTGRYRQSISHEVNADRGEASIGSNLEYAKVIEYGLDPGTFVSASSLEGWARRHGMRRGAAHAISRRIFERGLPEKEVLQKALKDSESDIKRHFGDLSRSIEKNWERKT
jgi:phage gpG-like protein